MKILLISSFVAAALCGTTVGQVKSTYTSTDTRQCKTIESSTKGAGYYRGLCAGVGGYKVELEEGDIRQTLNVITPSKKKFELDLWAFYSAFSRVGDKIEWRSKGGVPYALIARYYVADPEGVKKDTPYLIVAKVGPKMSCVTDVVLPATGQNETARTLADAAPQKPCKSKE